ncbi:MAG: hypothetical protein QGI09_07635 [Dehalococcoidia bacterium]|jgi:hypothetical protein|nr:hypothetical protein [Dehalococcoidia bacterium]
MMLVKGCHRCWVDLCINKDTYGEYRQCVQCGYIGGLEPSALLVDTTKPERKAA